eukprot:4105858-Amphidinium_carterae.1
MGSGSSTMVAHDNSALGTAFFQSWLLRHANGSVVGGAPMVRVGQSQVSYMHSLDDAGQEAKPKSYQIRGAHQQRFVEVEQTARKKRKIGALPAQHP